MNIYAKRGHKVKFIGATKDQIVFGGHDDPNGILKIGEKYIIDHTDIRSCHTKVILVGYEKYRFNSVSFDDCYFNKGWYKRLLNKIFKIEIFKVEERK